MNTRVYLALLLLLCLAAGLEAGEAGEQQEFEQELLHTFKQYDTNEDELLTQEEMFAILEEELPDKQAITDAIDMLRSLFEFYDKDQDGLDWEEYKELAQIKKTAFLDEEETSTTPGEGEDIEL
jgi:hypothetical protein